MRVSATILSWIVVGTTSAQTLLDDAVRLDEAVEDRSLLSQSLRVPRPDFRAPQGFDDVFRLRGGALARMDGGITAVFAQSVYRSTFFGDLPLIPPGTQFVIGEAPAWLAEQLGNASSAVGSENAAAGGAVDAEDSTRQGRVHRRVDRRVASLDPGPLSSESGSSVDGAASPFDADTLGPRVTLQSVRALMRRAAAAERERVGRR